MTHPPRRNSRLAATTLCIGALSQWAAASTGALNAPWVHGGWLAFSFGAVSLCEELGAMRPLNRAGLILLAAAFAAKSALVLTSDPVMIVRGELGFAISTLLAILCWSVALVHRPDRPKLAGLAGTAISGSGLALIVAAHLALGSGGYLGFREILSALRNPAMQTGAAMTSLSVLMVFWSLTVAALLRTQDINRPAA